MFHQLPKYLKMGDSNLNCLMTYVSYTSEAINFRYLDSTAVSGPEDSLFRVLPGIPWIYQSQMKIYAESSTKNVDVPPG